MHSPSNGYINGNSPKSANVLSSFSTTWWKTADVLELLDWLKDFNTKNSANPVHFYGFDTAKASNAMLFLQSACPRLKADHISICNQHLTDYGKYTATQDWVKATTEATELSTLLANSSLASGAKVSQWIQQFAILLQQAAIRSSGVSGARDKLMADNVIWIQKLQAGQKQVLWAHNDHIKSTSGTMGQYIKLQFGSNYKTLGFSFNQGDVLRYNFVSNVVEPIHFEPCRISMDGVFAATKQESLYFSPSATV